MQPHDQGEILPEFSRIVLISDLGPHPHPFLIEATKEEAAALAKRFGLLELKCLKAKCEIWRKADTGTICLKAELSAEVVQNCVITFVPVGDLVHAEVKEYFEQNESLVPDIEEEIEFDLSMLEDEDYPEHITGNELDVGEIIAQNLSLSLNPYPKAPGADLAQMMSTKDETKQSPFANLSEKLAQKDLKSK